MNERIPIRRILDLRNSLPDKDNRKTEHRKQYCRLLGCSPAQYRAYIQARFLPGMTWENYGKGKWEIKQIKPCSSFDLTDPHQQEKCFHYTNTQPLWKIDNRRKMTM